MNKTTEALKLAEEALYKAESVYEAVRTHPIAIQQVQKALAAIREALAEPVKQKQVAKVKCQYCGDEISPKGHDCGESVQPVKQEPVAELFLGGIADGEYGECEVDPYQMVIEALQERLVKDGNAVRLELYAAPVQPVKQEPVEFQMICPRCLVDRVTTPCPNRGGANDCPITGIAQKTAPVDAKAIRAEALEEAAKVCEEQLTYGWEPVGKRVAADIRGLK